MLPVVFFVACKRPALHCIVVGCGYCIPLMFSFYLGGRRQLKRTLLRPSWESCCTVSLACTNLNAEMGGRRAIVTSHLYSNAVTSTMKRSNNMPFTQSRKYRVFSYMLQMEWVLLVNDRY